MISQIVHSIAMKPCEFIIIRAPEMVCDVSLGWWAPVGRVEPVEERFYTAQSIATKVCTVVIRIYVMKL